MTAPTLNGAAEPGPTCHICHQRRAEVLRLTPDGELEPTGALHCAHCDRHCDWVGCPVCQDIVSRIGALIEQADGHHEAKGQPK